jgi:PAS domain S-box-containing protein
MHEQSELWRIAIASIGDAVITADVEERVTFLNPAAESLTGWTLGAALGQPLESVCCVDEEDAERAEPLAIRALREGVVAELANRTRLIAKDGTQRYIAGSAAPLRTDCGEVAGVVLVFRDVSGRREAERTLQKALAYTDDIIATIRQPFIVLERDFRVRTANRAFYEAFHVSKEETETRSLFELGNGQWDIPALRAALEELASPHHRSFGHFQVEHEFPAIGRRIMVVNARRFPPESKNFELILLGIEDITERRAAEAELRHSEVKYRRLFEAARDGILILDASTGKIRDANQFLAAMLDYSKEELLGKDLWQIGLFRDIEASRAAFRQLLERGCISYSHLPLQTKDGRQVEVEFVSNVYPEDSKPVIQCNIRDITERAHLERAKVQAEALADLNRRKDEFLAMLSHEIRNPLAPIMNAVQLLSLEQANETSLQRQARGIIQRQVIQLKNIIDDLLEVSRITTGRVRLRKENLDLRGIVSHAVDMVRPQIEERQQVFTASQGSEPIWVHADSLRLGQVVVNLLTNATKYTNVGGHIGLTVQQEGGEAVLRVRDTGIGIEPELLPRVFELFTQSERSLDRSHGGLGIGLTVVRRLVEMHGGSVEVHSALGRGSEFIVRLPTMTPIEPQAPAHQAGNEQTGPSLRVLVVDDNVDAANTLAMLVSAGGHDIRTAHDGHAALQVAREYRPDVMLLDIGLPGLDGYEVAKQIRETPALQKPVLVAMTGYGQDADRQRSQETGFDHHLVKPADFRAVQEILGAVSEKGERADAATGGGKGDS